MNPLRNNAKLQEEGQANHVTLLAEDIAPDVLFPWSNAANSRGRKRYPGIYVGEGRRQTRSKIGAAGAGKRLGALLHFWMLNWLSGKG